MPAPMPHDTAAHPAPAPASAEAISRRGWLDRVGGTLAWAGFGLLGVVGVLWTAATVRFLMPNATIEPVRRFRAGRPADYPPGHVETKYQETHGVWVVHGEQDGRPAIFALSTVCTHLGCIVLWNEAERRFKCPCHGSDFRSDGVQLAGPAPRPLPRYAIRVAEDGQLEVDRGQTFRAELGQWNDPRSFVPT